MKQIQCKLRTSSAVQDWLAFVARIESVVSSPSFRVNGKQQNGEGYYTSLKCDVEQAHLTDVLTEYIAFLERKQTLSFELVVQDTKGAGQSNGSQAGHTQIHDDVAGN